MKVPEITMSTDLTNCKEHKWKSNDFCEKCFRHRTLRTFEFMQYFCSVCNKSCVRSPVNGEPEIFALKGGELFCKSCLGKGGKRGKVGV